jgi:hypothetical protein
MSEGEKYSFTHLVNNCEFLNVTHTHTRAHEHTCMFVVGVYTLCDLLFIPRTAMRNHLYILIAISLVTSN